MPAALHEAKEAPAGARPGSADRRQLRPVALHHLHHDVQDVFLVCKGKARKSGQLPGVGRISYLLEERRRPRESLGTRPGDTVLFPLQSTEVSEILNLAGHTCPLFSRCWKPPVIYRGESLSCITEISLCSELKEKSSSKKKNI